MSSFIMARQGLWHQAWKSGRRQVMLVLIALQKLASSSVAAVLSALETRRSPAGLSGRKDQGRTRESN